jgi:2-keto-4-pentenoate hydratase/2-oxohepta-3-ene-1,7-dioic acid hydratase in catechol pathway
MRLARLQTPSGPVDGRYEDGVVVADDGEYVVGRDGRLTYPCSPSALYCVGRNFAETLDQMDYERPEQPAFFIKPPASLLGPDRDIRYPAWTDELTYAGELAAVVDRRCRDVDPDAFRASNVRLITSSLLKSASSSSCSAVSTSRSFTAVRPD